ncbi:MAG TPA: maleylpyruvate isomerase family mycothiol-dependent enzyme [Acidimicrobiia bacterium]|nr:maleylpyruvate isomerase family mycothiol-dependent enzyme [Acidimicrobiia bacterium]
MTTDADLAGLDPFDLLDREAARLDAWFSTLPEEAWSRPSRCEGWSVRDLLAHLASGEDYHRACLDGEVKVFLDSYFSRGAADVSGFNALAIADLEGRRPAQLLEQWRTAGAENRRRFRERGDGTIDTSIGEYPNRWQAFHVASELAVHADDAGVPVTGEERDARREWLARFCRFALREAKPALTVSAAGGRTRVEGDGTPIELDDETLIAAVTGRAGDDPTLDPATRARLSTMP